MADEETVIRDYGTGTPMFRAVAQDDKTVICDYQTGTPMFVIDGEIGGGVKVMTTAERTAITPDAGDLIYDSDQDVLYLGDGVTAGGNALGGSGGGDYIAGRWVSITGGTMISGKDYEDIEEVTSSSVTMKPGHAYSINATVTGTTLNTEVFATSKFGREGHLQIFTANTGYVVTGDNVYLKERLEPDSINNCTVRFHGGSATISVEDHIGGYIVVSATGTSSGTLPYGLASAGSQYIAFNDTLGGQVIDMNNAVTNGVKAVVGNGYTETIISGGVNCTAKTTFANLAMSGVVNSGGTMTLGDVNIPSSGTVTVVSGGSLAIEKVVGSGTVDLGGTNIVVSPGVTRASGCTFRNGYNSTNGGGLYANTMSSCYLELHACSFSSCTTSGNGGAIMIGGSVSANLTSCTFASNAAYTSVRGNALFIRGGSVSLSGCMFGSGQGIYVRDSGYLSLEGSNTVYDVGPFDSSAKGYVTIASGAIIDLTENTNGTPINPGGGVTFAPGGATVLYGSDSAVSSMTISGATVASIDNVGGVSINSAQAAGMFNWNASFSGVIMSMAGTPRVGNGSPGNVVFSDCELIGEGFMYYQTNYGYANITFGGTCKLTSTIKEYGDSVLSSGTITIKNGTTLDLTSALSASVISAPNGLTVGDGTSATSCSLIVPGGTTVSIAGGAYTVINKDGTTVPTQA